MSPRAVAAALGPDRARSPRSGSSHSLRRAALVLAALMVLAFTRTAASAGVPDGVWLIDGKAAVQIFECSGLLCGRILWLRVPRDAQGRLNLDRNNPDPALRPRRLCGLTILWGLRPTVPDRLCGRPEHGNEFRCGPMHHRLDPA
ncbi:DUF2147 domain-containing protein [Siccirubricoccus sp. G192]|uniref:DUF2147 domain-containing protein n=1 Tax=Siccirubricoccus sp. G192 TaxID=2849651 RepID=UPI001C2C7C82|nr:DUF2147 domain-containing protein [Siccirubricoccus sp. G192]MBV1800372.1 DUF2147 domain-containing protein [Siccirubricoccus sp. G192]